MVRYCDLFKSFFKIGTFTLGGGYAMIPLMEKEIVERHNWFTQEEFMDSLAVSQALPGVFAVNMATSVGFRLKGAVGALTAVVATIMVPIMIILLLAFSLDICAENVFVKRFFMGVRPAVVALIAAPLFRMAKAAKLTKLNCWIPIATIILIVFCDISPIFVIIIAILCFSIYFFLFSK